MWRFSIVSVLADIAERDVTVRVSRSTDDFLNQAKAQGHAKKNVFKTLVAMNECFNNKVTYGLTEKTILQQKFLESLREDMVLKNATQAELNALDDAIKAVTSRLKLYRENDGDEGDV